MPRRVTNPEYKGILVERMDWKEPDLNPLISNEIAFKEIRQMAGERFNALFQHYNIAAEISEPDGVQPDIEAWRKLAINLAITHVPAFQQRYEKKGAKKRTPEANAKLIQEIQARVEKSGLSERNACSKYAVEHPELKLKGGAVATWYFDAKRKMKMQKALADVLGQYSTPSGGLFGLGGQVEMNEEISRCATKAGNPSS